MNGTLKKTIIFAGLYVSIELVFGRLYFHMLKVKPKQFFNDTSSQNDRRFVDPFMCEKKCLFYVTKYYLPFERVFDKVNLLSKRPLGFGIFRFYCIPHVTYSKVAQGGTGGSFLSVFFHLFLLNLLLTKCKL